MNKPHLRDGSAENVANTAAPSRSLAKDIAELALFFDLTERGGQAQHLEAATAKVARERPISATTLKRCASEARALIEFARESGAIHAFEARADGSDWGLRQDISAKTGENVVIRRFTRYQVGEE